MTASKTAKFAAPVTPLFDFSHFELPGFALPKFELPRAEMPAAFRAVAEQAVAQTKAGYDKAKATTEQAIDVLERSYAAGTEGAAALNRQVIDAARANANAGFEYALALLAAKTPNDVVEISAEHSRGQFQALAGQAKALGELVQKLATETAEPIKTGMTEAFQKAA